MVPIYALNAVSNTINEKVLRQHMNLLLDLIKPFISVGWIIISQLCNLFGLMQRMLRSLCKILFFDDFILMCNLI